VPSAAVALVLVATTLRLPIASIAPVVEDISDTFHLTSATAGMLTALPVLCFGLLAPLTPLLARRLGLYRPLAICLALIGTGTLMRALPSVHALFAGTLLIGAGTGVATVLLPSIVKREMPHRPGLASGLYATALGGGATIAAGLTIPLVHVTGSWSVALAIWGLPALAAAGIALSQGVHEDRPQRLDSDGPRRRLRPWREAVGWQVSGLMASQSFLYYATGAWLPTILVSKGYTVEEGGAMLAVFNLAGLPMTLLAPALAGRHARQGGHVAVMVAILAAGMLGFVLAPGAAWWWSVLAGAGSGGAMAMALVLVVLRSPTPMHTASLAGMAQTVGYLVASLGPVAAGAMHTAAGGWDVPLLALTALTLPMLWLGMAAGRPRHATTGERGLEWTTMRQEAA
jgi:CP family cyanate transporter-like MFS transporter